MASLRPSGSTNVSSHHAVVLYDPEDGRVLYVHHFVVVEGADAPPREAWEQHAKETAGRLGGELPAVAALHVAGDEIEPRVRYRVDTETQTLARHAD